MDTHKKLRVPLSALADGELPSADLELALAALHTPDGKQAWDTYFRIGDALRAQATPELSDGFEAALRARLDAEPVPGRRAAPKGGDSPALRRAGGRAGGAGRRAAASLAAGAGAEVKDELPADGKAVVLPKPAIASVS